MKKIIITFLLILFILPISVQAFSFSDLLWWQKPVIEEELIPLNINEKESAENKFSIWKEAYDSVDMQFVLDNNVALTISAEELQYILEERLKDFKEPPIKDVQIEFIDNNINLKGYLLKPLKGNIELDIRPVVLDDGLYLNVKKAKYKIFYLPTSLVGRLVFDYIEYLSKFLFSVKDYPLKEITIDKTKLQLVY